jgi:hypothetical protein
MSKIDYSRLSNRTILIITDRAGRVVQAVQCLPSKCEALSTTKKKNQ